MLNSQNFLQSSGMIQTDILRTDQIRYHIDSATFLGMVESNVNLLKRLNQAPSGFMISGQRFGQSQSSAEQNRNNQRKMEREKFKSGQLF